MNQKNSAPLSTNTACHPELVSGSQIKNSAFTLIELLVVIVIVGILATVSVAQFNDYQERARFAKAVAFASQVDTVLMAETVSTGYGFPLRLDFDEGSGTIAKDSSGSGNDTVSWGSQAITWSTDTPDNSEYAVKCDPCQFWSENVKNMPEDELTFSAFVKIDQIKANGTYPLFINSNSSFFVNGNMRPQFVIPGGIIYGTDNMIKLNQWHHYLGTYKDGVLRFFLDGNLVGRKDNISLNVPFNMHPTTGVNPTLYIGYLSTWQQFYGSIDRLRIYPVGLDPDNL